MTIFDFKDKEALGSVISVDTTAVIIRVDDLDRLKRLQVNRLVVLQSSKPGQHLIGIVVKITRKPGDSDVDPEDDDLEEPQHLGQRFEAVVANPPFSAKWKGKDNPLNETDDRFSQYGALAPTSKADFAFVEHMIYQLADNGTMAVVLPHGVLFRGAAEGKIRKYMIHEMNILDAVIGLPPNLFYGTSIPACILVIKKCRVHDDNILFIDASAEFEKQGNQNVLTDAQVDKIVATYAARQNIDKYAHVAPLSEVAENDYNLNIPRYVDTFEEEEPVDIKSVATRLHALESDMARTDASIAGFCKELGIPAPF